MIYALTEVLKILHMFIIKIHAYHKNTKYQKTNLKYILLDYNHYFTDNILTSLDLTWLRS